MLTIILVTLGGVLFAEAIAFLGWRAWRAVKERMRVIDLATGINLSQVGLALVGVAIAGATLAAAVLDDDGDRHTDGPVPSAPTANPTVPTPTAVDNTPEPTAPGSPSFAPLEVCVDGVTPAETYEAREGDTLFDIAGRFAHLNRRQISECNGWPPREERTFSATEKVLYPVSRVEAKDLPLEVRIGQMLMTGFDPKADSLEDLIRDYHVGNFILDQDNVLPPDEMVGLTGQIQTWAKQGNKNIAALIAVDQEGHEPTSRLSSQLGYTAFGAALVLGCSGNLELTRDVARVMAEEMRAVGLNMNLAPVMDVNDNPNNPCIGDRAFGVEPGPVTAHGVAFIEGLQGAAVAATAKHYPGHGNTSIDSHIEVPIVDKSRSDLEAVELAPFKAAVEANVAAIMTAHVLYPKLDPEHPATLSPKIVSEILRGELGFNGVVMTDALNQGTFAGEGDERDEGETAVRAVEAGVDLIAFGDANLVGKIYDALTQAVREGRITEQRINDSVDRILRMKRRFRFESEETNPGAVNSEEHRAVLKRFRTAAGTDAAYKCLIETGLQFELP